MDTSWSGTGTIKSKRYVCSYCNCRVSSDTGYKSGVSQIILICPDCDSPTYFPHHSKDKYIPSPSFGENVINLPDDVKKLYAEARRCMSVSAYSSTVMLCRKLLMHIAVEKGAKGKLSFSDYVNWLDENNYIPPDGKGWVDYIRKKGNETNHVIQIMEKDDAEKLITFIGMLMKIIYEYPSMIPQPENGA